MKFRFRRKEQKLSLNLFLGWTQTKWRLIKQKWKSHGVQIFILQSTIWACQRGLVFTMKLTEQKGAGNVKLIIIIYGMLSFSWLSSVDSFECLNCFMFGDNELKSIFWHCSQAVMTWVWIGRGKYGAVAYVESVNLVTMPALWFDCRFSSLQKQGKRIKFTKTWNVTSNVGTFFFPKLCRFERREEKKKTELSWQQKLQPQLKFHYEISKENVKNFALFHQL